MSNTFTSPQVSVCIGVYNQARFITACLDSVLQDGYPNLQICLINDGSTDESATLIRDWMRQHPEVDVRYEDQRHLGLTATYNRLIRLAQGTHIAWLDGDDVLTQGGIQARLTYLETHRNKAAVFGDSCVIDIRGNVIHETAYHSLRWASRRLFTTDEGLKKQLLLRWSMPGSNILIKRNIYDRIGLNDETLAEAHDYDMVLRLLADQQLGFVNTRVAGYRLHDKNHSWVNRTDLLLNFWPIARKNAHLFGAIDRFCLYGFAAAAQVRARLFRLFGR